MKPLTVMGSFIADLAFRTPDLPRWGQTMLGSEFRLGPGGKGSNQAVAAARLGARVSFISMLGRDPFGDLARETYKKEGIDTRFVFESAEFATGTASIVIHETKGENAIVVVPGSGFAMTSADVDRARPLIEGSSIFMTQLETRVEVVEHALRIAHSAGVRTIFNPAPAMDLPRSIYALCDYFTPNETEAEALSGSGDPMRAGEEFLARGVRNVIITLGAEGALIRTREVTKKVPAIDAGPVVETTGAGDAFNGGFAVALAEGRDVVEAARFGCAVAGISVTRPGTAPSMPARAEVDALLRRS